jgi:hypothetical protein
MATCVKSKYNSKEALELIHALQGGKPFYSNTLYRPRQSVINGKELFSHLWLYENTKGYVHIVKIGRINIHKQLENGQTELKQRAFCITDYLLKSDGTLKESGNVGEFYYHTLDEAIQDLYRIWDFTEEIDCTNKEVTE